jgi:hypothetical protein
MDDAEKQKHYDIAEKLLAEENFAAAVIAGAAATVLAAVAYGLVVSTWRFSYGFAAAGIGIVVGLAMGFLGRGISTRFAVVASLYTLVGCFLGNVARAMIESGIGRASSPIDVFRNSSLPAAAGQAMSYISLIDLVYWFVAVFCAAFLARRPLSRSERLSIGTVRLRQ